MRDVCDVLFMTLGIQPRCLHSTITCEVALWALCISMARHHVSSWAKPVLARRQQCVMLHVALLLQVYLLWFSKICVLHIIFRHIRAHFNCVAVGWDVHAIWTDAMLGSSRFAYDVLLQLVRSISSRWDIALNADEIKSFRALVVAFLMITRTASLRMRSHALAQGLVYGTGILIVIDALDAIAQVPSRSIVATELLLYLPPL